MLPVMTAAKSALLLPQFKLTVRERQVADCLLAGQSPTKIARKLRVDRSTVRSYVCRLFAKLEANDPVEMVLKLWSVENSRRDE